MQVVPPLHIVQEVSGVKYPVFPFEKKEWKWKVFQKSFGVMQDIALKKYEYFHIISQQTFPRCCEKLKTISVEDIT